MDLLQKARSVSFQPVSGNHSDPFMLVGGDLWSSFHPDPSFSEVLKNLGRRPTTTPIACCTSAALGVPASASGPLLPAVLWLPDLGSKLRQLSKLHHPA